jgi:hypothetical protein
VILRAAARRVFRRSNWPFEDGTGQFRTAFIVIVGYWTAQQTLLPPALKLSGLTCPAKFRRLLSLIKNSKEM